MRASYRVFERNAEDSNGVLVIEIPTRLLGSEATKFSVTGGSANSSRWFGIYEVDHRPTFRPQNTSL
jgi:hypothetical protein